MTPLRNKIRDSKCKECNLYKSANYPCLIGDGSYPVDFMIIGEAPCFHSDSKGIPFSGKSGKSVDLVLDELGVDLDEIFITNAVHCRPPENRTPKNSELKTCRQWLLKEINHVKPKKILCLGLPASKAIMGKYNFSQKSVVGKNVEVEFPHGTVKVYFTYHPAKLFYEPHLKEEFKLTFESFFDLRKRTDVKARPWNLKNFLAQYKGDSVVDIETTGLDFKDEELDIVSVAMSPKKGVGYYIDVDSNKQWEEATSIILSNKSLIIGHNLKFDLKWMISRGMLPIKILYEVDKFHDTLLSYNVLNENRLNKGLKPLSYDFTSMIEYKEPNGLKTNDDSFDFEEQKEDTQLYNCRDVDANKRLKNYIVKQLNKEPELWTPVKIDMRTMAVCTYIELRGFKIDERALDDVLDEYEKKMKRLRKAVPVDNPNSAPQLKKFLTEDLGLRIENTQKETLQALSKKMKNKKKKAIVDSLLEYKGEVKNLSFLSSLEDKATYQGIVHPTYHIAKREDFDKKGDTEYEGGTVTGRLSCKDPNFQQMPRAKESLDPRYNPRRIIIPRSKDRIIMSSDFSQIEMAIAGIMSGEEILLDSYSSGGDMHTDVAAEVFGVKKKNVTDDMRKAAKTVNFGVIYGISEYGLAIRLGWTEDEAKVFIRKYFKKLPKIKENMEKLQDQAIRNKYVENYFHRRRRLPAANRNTREGKAALRQASNSPIQGTAGDLTKIVMWEIFLALKEMKSFLIGQVHDETVKDVLKKEKKEVIEIVKEVYSNPPLKDYGVEPFPIKIRGEIEMGPNWLEKKEVVKF
jgi:uracil-DNA glycosylase family 4